MARRNLLTGSCPLGSHIRLCSKFFRLFAPRRDLPRLFVILLTRPFSSRNLAVISISTHQLWGGPGGMCSHASALKVANSTSPFELFSYRSRIFPWLATEWVAVGLVHLARGEIYRLARQIDFEARNR